MKTKHNIIYVIILILGIFFLFLISCKTENEYVKKDSQMKKWEQQVRDGEITNEEMMSLIRGENDIKTMKRLQITPSKK